MTTLISCAAGLNRMTHKHTHTFKEFFINRGIKKLTLLKLVCVNAVNNTLNWQHLYIYIYIYTFFFYIYFATSFKSPVNHMLVATQSLGTTGTVHPLVIYMSIFQIVADLLKNWNKFFMLHRTKRERERNRGREREREREREVSEGVCTHNTVHPLVMYVIKKNKCIKG